MNFWQLTFFLHFCLRRNAKSQSDSGQSAQFTHVTFKSILIGRNFPLSNPIGQRHFCPRNFITSTYFSGLLWSCLLLSIIFVFASSFWQLRLKTITRFWASEKAPQTKKSKKPSEKRPEFYIQTRILVPMLSSNSVTLQKVSFWFLLKYFLIALTCFGIEFYSIFEWFLVIFYHFQPYLKIAEYFLKQFFCHILTLSKQLKQFYSFFVQFL